MRPRFETLVLLAIAPLLVSCTPSAGAPKPSVPRSNGASAVPAHPTAGAVSRASKRHLKGYESCFLLEDLRTGKRWTVGGALCKERLAPCSTFKIVNSLIGLKTGAAKGVRARRRWDGKKKYLKVWERDHTLESAFKNSVVWYYQALALDIGRKRMERHLARLGYGNETIGEKLTTFWLTGALTISPHEQLELVGKLYRDKLPFSPRAVSAVRAMMENADALPHFGGKTGTCVRLGKTRHGWFVGAFSSAGGAHQATAKAEYVFVTLVRGERAAGSWARERSKLILRDLGLLKLPPSESATP